jgi:cytochrome c peroxidase
MPTSPGHKKQLGGRNSPTVYNAGGHIAQFWDGRAADLETQAKGPVLNPGEMAMPEAPAVEKVLESMPEYVAMFKKAFPNEAKPVTFNNMALAIGAFERGLVTPGRFDAFLKGDASALTEPEKQGLKTFVESGCTACHAGAGVGGHLYQKLGLVVPWPNQKDLGRFEVTKNEADKMFFRVPSLRNVAKTGPYFHDGKVATLEEAVSLMGKHQLGKTLEAGQVKQIVTFLNALTGELPTAYIKEPKLPKSSPSTPKPNPS